jgi:hypothetical protein
VASEEFSEIGIPVDCSQMRLAKYASIIGQFRYGVMTDLVQTFSRLARENNAVSHDGKVSTSFFGNVTSLNGKGDSAIVLVSLPRKLDAMHFWGLREGTRNFVSLRHAVSRKLVELRTSHNTSASAITL